MEETGMKAIRASLTFFIDDASDEETEIRKRLEALLRAELKHLENWDLRWLDDAATFSGESENIASKLDRLDT
jgi:hypothetical protein